jgi:hypothetical protein
MVVITCIVKFIFMYIRLPSTIDILFSHLIYLISSNTFHVINFIYCNEINPLHGRDNNVFLSRSRTCFRCIFSVVLIFYISKQTNEYFAKDR